MGTTTGSMPLIDSHSHVAMGGCVAFQKRNLTHGLAEKIIGRIFIADHRQFMLNKRMIDNG